MSYLGDGLLRVLVDDRRLGHRQRLLGVQRSVDVREGEATLPIANGQHLLVICPAQLSRL